MSAENVQSLRQRLADVVGSAPSVRGQLVRGGIGTIGVQIGARILLLATSVALARLLGAGGYGAYSFAMAAIGLLAIPVELGLPRLIIREVAIYRRRAMSGLMKGLLVRANQVVLILSIVMGLAATIGVYALGSITVAAPASTLLWSVASLPLLGLSAVRSAALRGLGWVACGQFIQAVLRPGIFLMLIGVVAWVLPRGAFTPTIAVQVQIVALLAVLLLGYVLLSIALPSGIRSQAAEYEDHRWFSSSMPFVLLAGSQVILQHTSTLMLGVLGTPADVGIYRVVSQGALLVVFAHTAVSTVIEPHVASLSDAGARDRLQRLVSLAAKASLIGALPIALLFMFFGRGILAVVFGQEFAAGHVPLLILSVGHLFNAAMGSVGLILNMSGNAWYTTAGVGTAAAVTVVGSAILIPPFWSTSLEPDELLTGVSFPVWSGRCGFAIEEFARRHGDFAIAGAVVAVELDGDDRVHRCGIGLIGLGSTPLRATAAEDAATRNAASEIDARDLGRAAVADLASIPADLHGSSRYRARVGATMVERAWQRAIEEALGG